MENILEVETRTESGKGSARKLRATGRIPGILYGHESKPLSFSVDPKVFRKQMKASGYGRNTVLHVSGLERRAMALLKSTQIDPLKRNLLHIDLIEVRDDEKVSVKIPLSFPGRAKGVFLGGQMAILERDIAVECVPSAIPKEIVHDVTELDCLETIYARDLKLPEGVVVSTSGDRALVTIGAAPKAKTADEGEEEKGS